MINSDTLTQLRVNRGLSQRKLAHLAGVNFQVIRRIEAGGDDGNLTLRHLARICESLRVSPADLLQTDTVPAPPQPHAEGELSTAQARLLRNIQRGRDVRRTLSVDERAMTLPSLVRLALVTSHRGGRLRLTDVADQDLVP